MQSNNRLFDDFAKMAGGAVSTLVGVRDEVKALVRQQAENLMSEMDLVTREEFEVMKAVAIKARTEQEKLEQRVAELEATLKAAGKAAPRKSGKKSTRP